MYRYFVFAYDDYYPSGGMGDVRLKTNDLMVADIIARSLNNDSVYIYDSKEDKYIDFN